jgi:hypothetical protein
VSHSGLIKFLGGSRPHPHTLKKLRVWFHSFAAPEGRVEAAINMLVDALPESRRLEGRDRLERLVTELRSAKSDEAREP